MGNSYILGNIPPEIGNLENLESLQLSGTSLTGKVPIELGKLTVLKSLFLFDNNLTGALPVTLPRLINLRSISFNNNDGLCAPLEVDFQSWLKELSRVKGGNCTKLQDSFTSQISNKSYFQNAEIESVILPELNSNNFPIKYTIDPELPNGLSFDPQTRTLNGIPSELSTPVIYTYIATDANGDRNGLLFTIEIVRHKNLFRNEINALFFFEFSNQASNSTRILICEYTYRVCR